MIRAFVTYEGEVDPERYERHVEDFAKKVPEATFRYGRVTGSPLGEPAFHWYAEFEWPDKDSFRRAVGGPEFAASGKDGMEMGVPFKIHFAEISE